MPVTQEIGSSIISCGTASHLATSAFINSLHGFPTPHWTQLVTYNTELFSYSVESSPTCLVCTNAPKYALPTHCSCAMYSIVHVYYGLLGINHKCPDYQGILIINVSWISRSAYMIKHIWDHNSVCRLCRCPYFQVSWFLCMARILRNWEIKFWGHYPCTVLKYLRNKVIWKE